MNSVFFGKRFYFCITVFLFLFLQGCSTKYIVKSPKYAEYEGEINQHTRLIKTERSQVFHILTHEETFSQVCPKGTIVTHESPPPYQVGTLVKTRVEHIFRLGWNSRVQEVIRDRKIRLRFLNGFLAGGTEIWELESTGKYTQVTHTIIVQPKGFIRKLAWNLKVRLKHDKMVEAFLDNLKRALETH